MARVIIVGDLDQKWVDEMRASAAHGNPFELYSTGEYEKTFRPHSIALGEAVIEFAKAPSVEAVKKLHKFMASPAIADAGGNDSEPHYQVRWWAEKMAPGSGQLLED